MTKDIDAAMNSMPPGWKSRWCNSHMCACLGCANKAGGLTAKGYTYQDWRDWISRNKEDYMNGLSPIKEVKWSGEFEMNSKIKNNLISIQKVAAKALEEHINSTERFAGVNYADLRVVDVYVRYSLGDSREYYGVLIEECTPSAGDLYQYMKEFLQKNLPDDLGCYVEVECEW